MPDPNKLQAKLQKAEAEAQRDRAAVRARAEKKIAKVKNELRAEEAKIVARLERRREKTRAKLETLGRSLDGGAAAAALHRVTRRARTKR
jgi:hypothetical protein